MEQELNNPAHYEQIIVDGIHLLESIGRYYGPEKSIEIWDKMGEAMGPDIKGRVFFALLTGSAGDRVHIQRGNCDQAVTAIKAIRYGTNMGLKESKDAWDASAVRTVMLQCVNSAVQKEMVRELRNIGMRVL